MKRTVPYLILCSVLILASCGKDWLDERSDKSLVIPTTLSDLQALIDNTNVMNMAPALGTLSSDDYFIQDDVYQALGLDFFKNAYTWSDKNFWSGVSNPTDWTYPYTIVFYSNIVLEGLDRLKPGADDQQTRKELKGYALFHRANAFYQVATLFAAPYSRSNEATELGIPLRLSPDVKAPVVRSSMKETWAQILKDANEATKLLPLEAAVKTRPCRAAAYALLAKCYLELEDYSNALKAADSSFRLNSTIIDYNSLNQTAVNPFPIFNDEVLFHAMLGNLTPLAANFALVDTSLYGTYSVDDLRREIYFNPAPGGRFTFGGSYLGPSTLTGRLFGGIAADEVLLVRAECYARTGNVPAAMEDLNLLLKNRYKTDTYHPLTTDAADEALAWVLEERRKELVLRGTRFVDLRRLNKEARFAITLKRMVNDQEFTLPPNDKRYALPIPGNVIDISHIPQNPRQ